MILCSALVVSSQSYADSTAVYNYGQHGCGSLEMVKLLVRYGADVNAQDLYGGKKVLARAEENGCRDIADILSKTARLCRVSRGSFLEWLRVSSLLQR